MYSSSSSRVGATIFRSKATVLQLRRAVFNWRDGIRAHPQVEVPDGWKRLAVARSPLWNDAGEVDSQLERGKVHNLRAAVRRLNGARVEKGVVFSFWAQIGRATKRRGYAEGRLLREGCLMPAVGGGICQLSNALYEVALQGDLEILERYAHSKTIVGSAAQVGRDATVAWNYIDLRFRARQPFQIQAELTRDELVVSLWAPPVKVVASRGASLTLFDVRPKLEALAHSCASCGETSCFRNAPRPRQTSGQTVWVVDEAWPEWVALAGQGEDAKDVLLAARLEEWPLERWQRREGVVVAALRRSLSVRRAGKRGGGGEVWRTQLEATEGLARALARRLESEVTHVVVAQSLLPYLWQSGALGGRTFDVLLTRTPFDELGASLDEASALLNDATLADFRAPAALVRDEREALEAARLIYSPHAQLARRFGSRVQLLDWKVPTQGEDATGGPHDALVLAGSALARKGAHAVRDAALELGLPVVIVGRDWMGEEFWRGVERRVLASGECWVSHARVVVLPAIVEHQPRHLLRALAEGVPVICTPECGLGEREGVTCVAFGDSSGFIEALRGVVAGKELVL